MAGTPDGRVTNGHGVGVPQESQYCAQGQHKLQGGKPLVARCAGAGGSVSTAVLQRQVRFPGFLG